MTTHRQSYLCRVRTFHGESIPHKSSWWLDCKQAPCWRSRGMAVGSRTVLCQRTLGRSARWSRRGRWVTGALTLLRNIVVCNAGLSVALPGVLLTSGCNCCGINFWKAQIGDLKRNHVSEVSSAILGGKKNPFFSHFILENRLLKVFFLSVWYWCLGEKQQEEKGAKKFHLSNHGWLLMKGNLVLCSSLKGK